MFSLQGQNSSEKYMKQIMIEVMMIEYSNICEEELGNVYTKNEGFVDI